MPKTLGDNAEREVGQSLHDSEVPEGCDFDGRYYELLKQLSDDLQKVFSSWVVSYAGNDVLRVQQVFDVVKSAAARYGEFFVVSFFICGVRWEELSFVQFQQIFLIMDQAYDEKLDGSEDAAAKVQARYAGGNAGANFMRLLLDHRMDDPERIQFLKNVLLKHGKEVAERTAFLLRRHEFHSVYFEEAVNIVKLDRLFLAHQFLDVCTRWELDFSQAVRLSSNVVYLLNQKGGDEQCRKLLEGRTIPAFLGDAKDGFH